MFVLVVLGWVLLGLLALVVLLLALPATFSVRYAQGQLTAYARIFFVKIKLYPRPPKTREKPAPVKAEKPAGDEAEKHGKKKKRSPAETLDFAKRLAGAGWAAMKLFFRHARFHGIELVLPVHAEDAADTALRCGKIQALIGAVRALLEERLHLGYKRLVLIPDFTGRFAGELVAGVKLSFCPGVALGMGFVFLKHFLASRPRAARAHGRAAPRRRPAPPRKAA